MNCNQCEALIINGVFCHETGCPNRNSRYDQEAGEFIKQRKCFECGYNVDQDDLCCSAPMEDEEFHPTTFGEAESYIEHERRTR